MNEPAGTRDVGKDMVIPFRVGCLVRPCHFRLPRTRERGASFAGRWRLFYRRTQAPKLKGFQSA